MDTNTHKRARTSPGLHPKASWKSRVSTNGTAVIAVQNSDAAAQRGAEKMGTRSALHPGDAGQRMRNPQEMHRRGRQRERLHRLRADDHCRPRDSVLRRSRYRPCTSWRRSQATAQEHTRRSDRVAARRWSVCGENRSAAAVGLKTNASTPSGALIRNSHAASWRMGGDDALGQQKATTGATSPRPRAARSSPAPGALPVPRRQHHAAAADRDHHGRPRFPAR